MAFRVFFLNQDHSHHFPPLIASVRQAKQPVARGYLLGCSGECQKSGRYLPMPSGLPPCVTV